MKVTLRNPGTSHIKQLKIGWSWTCFFFGQFLGLPFFLRGLPAFGIVTLIWYISCMAFTITTYGDNNPFHIIVGLLQFAVALFFGLKANELTGKNYLKNGWVFESPDGEEASIAKQKWNVVV